MAGPGETVTYAELDDRSRRLAGALRARGIGAGDHVAVLMENNRPFLEVAWAAQRSGLWYTAINSHLLPGEVQYVLDDCGAVALVASEAMADIVAGLDLSRIPVRVAAAGDLPGFEPLRRGAGRGRTRPARRRDARAARCCTRRARPGGPRACARTLPGTPFGDPSATPVLLARALAIQGRGIGPGSVYLCPAPLYHSAPLVYSMSMQRLGATVVVMERFDPRRASS